MFVDADTTITPDLLRASIDALQRGAVGGGALPVLDKDVKGAAAVTVRGWHWLSLKFNWACGAYLFCRRDAFMDVGGFDERYYCSEEIHLSGALKRWGRKRNAPMVILPQTLTTSARKMDWYGPWFILGQFLRLLVPGAMRQRRNCELWYERPEK